MIPPARSQALVAAVGALALLIVIGVAMRHRSVRASAGQSSVTVARASAAPIGGTSSRTAGQGSVAQGGLVVDVAGSVRRPGVHHLPAGSRVLDAIAAAGGASTGADLTLVNRAALLVDGQQVQIPARVSANALATSAVPASLAGSTSPSGDSSSVGSTSYAAGIPVSINSATVEQLDGLDGIGPVMAQRIVDDRTAHGPFASVEDLDRVPGIGPARIEQMRARVTP